MLGIANHFMAFHKFNQFYNTEAHMLDSIYHVALKLFCNYFFGVKTSRFCHINMMCYGLEFVLKLNHDITKLWASTRENLSSGVCEQ